MAPTIRLFPPSPPRSYRYTYAVVIAAFGLAIIALYRIITVGSDEAHSIYPGYFDPADRSEEIPVDLDHVRMYTGFHSDYPECIQAALQDASTIWICDHDVSLIDKTALVDLRPVPTVENIPVATTVPTPTPQDLPAPVIVEAPVEEDVQPIRATLTPAQECAFDTSRCDVPGSIDIPTLGNSWKIDERLETAAITNEILLTDRGLEQILNP